MGASLHLTCQMVIHVPWDLQKNMIVPQQIHTTRCICCCWWKYCSLQCCLITESFTLIAKCQRDFSKAHDDIKYLVINLHQSIMSYKSIFKKRMQLWILFPNLIYNCIVIKWLQHKHSVDTSASKPNPSEITLTSVSDYVLDLDQWFQFVSSSSD